VTVSAEPRLGPSGDGTVILDIGGETGAVMLVTTSAWDGREIELEPLHLDVAPVHSAVRERYGSGETTFAAVYPQLRTGRYLVEGSQQVVSVTGGRVSEVVFAPRHGATAPRREHDDATEPRHVGST